MKCQNCNNEVGEDFSFCGNCGAAIEKPKRTELLPSARRGRGFALALAGAFCTGACFLFSYSKLVESSKIFFVIYVLDALLTAALVVSIVELVITCKRGGTKVFAILGIIIASVTMLVLIVLVIIKFVILAGSII